LAQNKKTEGKRQKYQRKVLDAVLHNSSLTLISKDLGKDTGNTHKVLRRLEEAGLIFQHNTHWHIDDAGELALSKEISNFEKTEIEGRGLQKNRNVLARPHHITICTAHKMDRDVWEDKYRGNMVEVWVPSLNRTLHIQFTRIGVQFVLQQSTSKNVMKGIADLHKKCRRIVTFIERKYKIRLVRPSDLGMCKLYSELAYLQTSWAEREIGTGRRMWLYNWKDDGKPRFVFDKSKSAELELTGGTVDDDAIETSFFLEKLGNGEVRETFDKVDALYAYIPELTNFMKNIAIATRENASIFKQFLEMQSTRGTSNQWQGTADTASVQGTIDQLSIPDYIG